MAEEKKHVMHHLGTEKSGAKKKEPKHHAHSVTVTRAEHGGHVIHHHMRDEDGNPAPDQTSVAMDNEDMGNQVQSAMADQPPAGQGTPPAPQPAPADPAAAAMGGQ